MIRITWNDIQCIRDAETLLHFLEEKLNLPIPQDLTLEDIATKFSNFALGLRGAIANQVLDCQELSVSLGQPSGIFLIRFTDKSGYAEVLRAIAEGLDQYGRNPADFRFICANNHFQPFAFAYFNDSTSRNWHTAVLTAFSWTPKNTRINTGSEHKLPAIFFSEASTDEFEDNLEDKTEINESSLTESPSGYDLSIKVENIGEKLGTLEDLCSGITTAYDRALIIDTGTREHLLAEDPNSIELIKRSPRVNQKWTCDSKYLICIPSSDIRQWPWSNTRNESAAECIFEETYPAIYSHLNRHRDWLKKRSKSVQGKFYWEMSRSKLYSIAKCPKIIYPLYPTSMEVAYDTLKGIPTSSFCIIPTSDLSLLGILNSNLCNWYAKTNYQKGSSNQLSLKKANMTNFPIAPRAEAQKVELSNLVQQILNNPDSAEVPNFEKEIDKLVYKLYELTAAEIALIEKEAIQFSSRKGNTQAKIRLSPIPLL